MQSKKRSIYLARAFFTFFILIQVLVAQPQKENSLYLDATQPITVRVEDLLGKMTIEEKIGQINMPCVYEKDLGKNREAKIDGIRKFTVGRLVDQVGPAGGFFTLTNRILQEGI